MSTWASSGVKGFDDIIQGLRSGDNVVWQIDDIESYRNYVNAFVAEARREKKKLVYVRFGRHAPLVEGGDVTVCPLDAFSGFESFSHRVHTIITEQGRGVYYVFDCLSDLLYAWATDLMIGNFFRVTCPYLYELDTIAYFALRRNSHSFKTIARIRETTQLLIDLYRNEGRSYVHPLKVFNRYSPTMFLPHVQTDGRLVPLASSVDASRFFEFIARSVPDASRRPLDYWDYLFLEAETLGRAEGKTAEKEEMVERLCRIMLSTDGRMIPLIKRYFPLGELLALRPRILGTGFIGGKALGMLLARRILMADPSVEWKKYLEPHDSFFIGSDVFYTYIVQNGWWRLWMRQKTDEGYFSVAGAMREKLVGGEFPEEITESFRQLIDYFGQSPIIVRSSSLQEDAFGNAFAGKYESIFLANQGSPEERFIAFVDAVRRVYASTMSEDALVYRQKSGLNTKDEQMALLVQRVSGSYHGKHFFPLCAGVGVSFNTYVWDKDIDPGAGVLRLVFGLGTRAVNRVEGDYPRIIALDRPKVQPLAGFEDIQRFSQHEVDTINLAENRLATSALDEIIAEAGDLPLSLVGSRPGERFVLTFDELLTETQFPPLMRKLLAALDGAYQYPVDIEFTLNLAGDDTLQVNLVQCRPLKARNIGEQVGLPQDLRSLDLLFSSEGNFVGGNIALKLCRVVYVDPKGYAELSIGDKYEVARIVGRINRLIDREKTPTVLLGPGRWGTTTPSLGVPVDFFEINNVAVLCELEFSSGNLSPEPSFGTHFFHDLIETGIFYAALFQEKKGVFFNRSRFEEMPNLLNELVPGRERFAGIIRVSDPARPLTILSDIRSQKLVCFES